MNEMLQRKNSQRRKQQQSGNVLLVVGTILFTTLVIFLLPTPATSFTLIARPALSQHATLFHQQSPLFQLSAAASIAEANDGNVYDNNSQQESSATTTSTNLSLFQNAANPPQLSPIQSALTRIGLMLFIASMCIALPLTLLPQLLLRKMNVISRLQGEQFALRTGQKCARNLMKLIPFCKIQVESDLNLSVDHEPEPCIWVCNHTSMLDVFVMLAADKRLRGPNKRPIKIVYWKQLEDNPVTKLLFQACGFIPVDMKANDHGQANEYDVQSFKRMLKLTKQAFQEGFDIGILPEGQLNPTPEQGLLPSFPGAFTLSKLSKRPIYMLAHWGVNGLWHPLHGVWGNSRQVKLRAYGQGRKFASGEEFVATFTQVVGHYGATGSDIDNYQGWLNGTAYEQQVKEATEAIEGSKEDKSSAE